MILKITDYVPIEPPFHLDILAFWIVPDKTSASGHKLIPIPTDIFNEYLLSLSE